MIKDLKECSQEENKRMFLYGTSYAMWLTNYEKALYEKSKKEPIEDLKNSEKISIQILSLLENLEYPMDELGTYLYGKVILSVCENLNEIIRDEDIEKYNKLVLDLNDAYSSFYLWIARDDLEIGLKTFHLYIERAISMIDYSKSNKNLISSIYDKDITELNYGEQALYLASYLLKIYQIENGKTEAKLKLKRLENLPGNIKLKEE